MAVRRRDLFALGGAVLGGVCAVAQDRGAPPSLAGSSRSMGGFPEADFFGVAADFDEVNAALRKIPPNDLEAFLAAWTDAATDVERRADKYLAARRPISAHEALLRASNYHSRVQQALLRIGDGQRIVEPYQRMRRAWDRAWTLVAPPFMEVPIRFGDTTLPGLFAPAGGCGAKPMPVVIEFSGSDHINHRAFFRSEWRKFHGRGLSYLTLEGPGQGEPLRLRKLFLRPDFDTVAAAAIDYLATRSDVDMARIGVFGTAFGGYFAAQAAVDPRVRAVACRSASFDLWQDAYAFCEPIRRHLEYMLGVEGEAAARGALAPFNLTSIAPRIRRPIAIYHGGRDDVQDPRGAQRLYDAIPSGRKILKILPDGPRSVGREPELELVDWLRAQIA